MKCLTLFLGFKSCYSQTRGNFYEEMTKFKAGLSERPQTFRKIEVSVISSGSCAGECPNREVAPNTMTFADAKLYCENLGKQLPVPSSADRIEEFKNEIFRVGIDSIQLNLLLN